MLEMEQLRLALTGLKSNIDNLRDSLDIAGTVSKIEELEKEAMQEGFWDDMENSQKVLKLTKDLKNKVERYENLKSSYDDTLDMIEMAEDRDMVMLCTDLEMFTSCGKLYSAGLRGGSGK